MKKQIGWYRIGDGPIIGPTEVDNPYADQPDICYYQIGDGPAVFLVDPGTLVPPIAEPTIA